LFFEIIVFKTIVFETIAFETFAVEGMAFEAIGGESEQICPAVLAGRLSPALIHGQAATMN